MHAPDELAPKQAAGLAALMAGETIRAAADGLGVDERTVRRWLAEPGFKAAFAEARRALVDDAVLALQRAAVRAVAVLADNLDADKAADRTKAATALLDRCFRGVELLELEARIAELEAGRKP